MEIKQTGSTRSLSSWMTQGPLLLLLCESRGSWERCWAHWLHFRTVPGHGPLTQLYVLHQCHMVTVTIQETGVLFSHYLWGRSLPTFLENICHQQCHVDSFPFQKQLESCVSGSSPSFTLLLTGTGSKPALSQAVYLLNTASHRAI